MLKFENTENGRFYYLSIQKDLLNDLVLCVNFGGSHSGRAISYHRIIHAGSREDIQREIIRLSKKRLRRGYELIY